MMQITEKDLRIICDTTSELLIEKIETGSRIFLSGATGFFGKWILEFFILLNKELGLSCQICALSRDPEKFLAQNPRFKIEKSITWLKGDIRSFKFTAEEFTYIIHAATDADAKLNFEYPLLMLDTITEGTKRILEFAARQSELKAFLLISSGAVYGNQPREIKSIKETDCFKLEINNPTSAYAEGKRLSELYGSIYEKYRNVPVKIARCFAFVGPHLPLDKHFAIGNFIRDGLAGKDIIVMGDGSPLRSYMYPSDLIIWLLTILLKGKRGEAYNVGSDRSISIKDLAIMIAQFFPDISVKILGQIRNTDRNFNYIPDVTKFKNEFNMKLNLELEEAILKTIQFYQKS